MTQNDLDHQNVKGTSCVTSIPESQIVVCFALRPAIFELENDPKMSLTLQGQRYPFMF